MGVENRGSHKDIFISNKEYLFKTLDPEHPLKMVPSFQGGYVYSIMDIESIKSFCHEEGSYYNGEFKSNIVCDDLSQIEQFDINDYEVLVTFCLITNVKEVDNNNVEVEYYAQLDFVPPFIYTFPQYTLDVNSNSLFVSGYNSKDIIQNWSAVQAYDETKNDIIECLKGNTELRTLYESDLRSNLYKIVLSRDYAENLGITIGERQIWKLNGSFKYPLTLTLGLQFRNNGVNFIIPDITENGYPVNFYIYPYEDLDYIVEADELGEIPGSGGSAVNCCDNILSKIDELKESIDNSTEDIKNTIKDNSGEGGQGSGLDDETKCKINRIDTNIISLRNMLR